MALDAIAIIEAHVWHENQSRVPFNTQQFIDWCQQLDNSPLGVPEANAILKDLDDDNQSPISLAHRYEPNKILGWFYVNNR